jgi:hypothetical protein
MNGNGIQQSIALQEIENELMEELRLRQLEWVHASHQGRDAARERFLEALRTFNNLVLYGKLPDNSK